MFISEDTILGKNMNKTKLNKINALFGSPTQENIDFLKMQVSEGTESSYIAALKVLGSYKDKSLTPFFLSILTNDEPQLKRREAMSCLGRLRDEKTALKIIVPFLKDGNPDIVIQAIRALVLFKDNAEIKAALEGMYSHKNELVRSMISSELDDNTFNITPKSHIEVNADWSNKVINGDALSILKVIPDETIHLTFTSPPYYNARDYSIYSSYSEYLDFLDKLFIEILRTTKSGRFVAVNTSPIIMPRAGRKYPSTRYPIPYDLHALMMRQGWEFVDDIVWLKPAASVKNRIGGFLQHRKPLSYKPNSVTESIMIYRKPSPKLIDWSIKSYPEAIIQESLILEDDFERTNVWGIDPVYDKNHSAVFPIELCNKIVRYYSMRGDLIFDPFAGSGTLGKSALKNGRNILLTELSTDYYKVIKENLSDWEDKITWESQETDGHTQ
jgi:DNA modification methylase